MEIRKNIVELDEIVRDFLNENKSRILNRYFDVNIQNYLAPMTEEDKLRLSMYISTLIAKLNSSAEVTHIFADTNSISLNINF